MPGPWSSKVSRSPRRAPSLQRLQRGPCRRRRRSSVLRASSLAAVTILVWSTRLKPSSTAQLAHDLPDAARRRRDARIGSVSVAVDGHRRPPSRRRGAAPEQLHAPLDVERGAHARQRQPSSTSVIATAGRMPTTTVSASSTRDMAAMLPSIRPMNESTISSAEMSISTPRAPVLDDPLGQVVLQRHRQPVVHVDLDRDQQELAHLEDRDAFHGARLSAVPGARTDRQPGALQREREARRPASPWW